MMRIEGISKSKVSFFVRLPFWLSQRRFGKVADPLRITGHHPWVSFGYGIKESRVFSPLEKRVLDYAEAMTLTPVEVPDELFATLREHFNEAQLVELTAAIP